VVLRVYLQRRELAAHRAPAYAVEALLSGYARLAQELACGLPLGKQGQPRIPSPSQQCKRRHAASAPLHESLFVLMVLQAIRSRLIGARDLIIDSAPILAWR
jgi:hypothetical protein